MNDWLENLKRGDNVIISSRHYDDIDHVSRVTKTQICVKSTVSKFRKSNGCRVGDACSWSMVRLVRPTEEKLNYIETEKVKSFVSNTRWEDIDYKKVKAVYDVLKDGL